jgi:hypothetical protein
MPIRCEVRDAQRFLAALDVAHAKALAALDRATERRAAALDAHDRPVPAAHAGADHAVAAIANQVSVVLAAQGFCMEIPAVRRRARAYTRVAHYPGRSRR